MFMIDLEVIREMPLDNNKLSGHWGIERERERSRRRTEGVWKGWVEGFKKQAFKCISLQTIGFQSKHKTCVHTHTLKLNTSLLSVREKAAIEKRLNM